MGTSVKRDMRRIATRELQNRALGLRARGGSYRAIAQQMDIPVSYVHKLVQSAIDAIPRERAEEVRTLELERLDRMLLGLGKRANSGDPRAVLASVRIMERRAAYLGLDAPKRQELTGEGGSALVIQVVGEAARAFDGPKDGDGGGGNSGAPS